jgi:hypothetical protein
MAIVVTVDRPDGTLLPELVHWLPTEALGEPIGTVSPAALSETSSIVAALVSLIRLGRGIRGTLRRRAQPDPRVSHLRSNSG